MNSAGEQRGVASRACEVRRTGDGSDLLRFAFWDVRRQIVFDNVAAFARAGSGHAVEATCIAGDYRAHVEETRPDVFYAQRAEAALWTAEELAAPLDETEPGIAAVLAGMDERMIAGARDAQGRLVGLTYYNGGPFALFLHADHADALAGRAAPRGMTDLVALARRLRRVRGLACPVLPRWHATQTGLTWSFLCHLAAEGTTDLAADGAEAAATRVLAGMRILAAEELVPPDALDDRDDRPATARWIGGAHALWFTMDYLAADAAEAAGRPISHALPYPGRRPLMPGHALLCLRAGLEGPRAKAAVRLLAWLGGPVVHRRWSAQALFGVPLAEQPDRGALARHFPPGDPASVENLLAARASACTSPTTRHPAALAFSDFADGLVRREVLVGSLSPASGARALVEAWRETVGRAEIGGAGATGTRIA